MALPDRNDGVRFQPNAHGGRNQRGVWRQAKNIHAKLSKPIHPDLEGVGVHVDLPDLCDRIENGNRFQVGAEIKGPNVYDNDRKLGITLSNGNASPNEDVGFAYEIGKVEGAIDGIGVKYNACGASSNIALGPVDIGGKIGTAEAGVKVWEPDVGLDVGIKANASAVEVRVGPINANMGVGIDTGLKVGNEGVGVEVLGTGFQFGRTMGVSLFGSSVSFKLW